MKNKNMIVFLFIWVIVWGLIVASDMVAYMLHPEDYLDKWWLLKIIGWGAIWPLILIAILVVGLYNTITMSI